MRQLDVGGSDGWMDAAGFTSIGLLLGSMTGQLPPPRQALAK